MDIKKAISQLSLPDGSFMVVGSGLLDTLGIRAAGDIDLLVSHDVLVPVLFMSSSWGWSCP